MLAEPPAYAGAVDGDVEYVGLVADSWDALRGDTSNWDDRHFYLDLIREGDEPALDIGCGTGRLLLDYLQQGIDIDGVDNSPEMLAICQSKADAGGLQPRLYLQRTERLRLPRRYRTTIVASSSFQLIIEPADAAEALRRFRDHLEPGGMLALPFGRDPADPYDETSTREATLDDGSIIRKTLRSVWDPRTQLESTDELFEVLRDGALVRTERHRRDSATRGYRPEQVRALLTDAGFGGIEWYSGFSREPARPADELYTVVARRRPITSTDDPLPTPRTPPTTSARPERGACRCPIGVHDAQREADQLVGPGRDSAQVEPLQDHDAGREELDVRRLRRSLRRDRQVVDPHQPHTSASQRRGGGGIETDEVGRECGAFPEVRVPRPEDEPRLPVGDAKPVERIGVDRSADRTGVDHVRRPDQRVERQCVDAGTTGDEVRRRIDVRAGVGAHLEARDIGNRAVRDRRRELDVDRRIARIGWHPLADRDADVDPVHGGA